MKFDSSPFFDNQPTSFPLSIRSTHFSGTSSLAGLQPNPTDRRLRNQRLGEDVSRSVRRWTFRVLVDRNWG